MMFPEKSDSLIGQWGSYVENILKYAATHASKYVRDLVTSKNDSLSVDGNYL